jgi:SAM-dependent methyltransferase
VRPPAQPYDAIAPAYDLLTAGHPHDAWLARVEALAVAHGLSGRRVLDVACGTGKSFAPLLQRGYVVIACDASSAMVARARARAAGRARVEVADMRALPALGPADLVTCLDDALCHLLSAQDVVAALEGIRRNLAPRGLAVFDIALPSAYAGAADAIADDERHVVLWRAPAGSQSAVEVEVRVDVFTARPDGLYERARLVQRHRRHTVAEIRRCAAAAGLVVRAVVGQQPGGVLCGDLDEARHRKALFVVSRR